MGSPEAVEINFNDNDDDTRQFHCASDGSCEEKSDTPPSPRSGAPDVSLNKSVSIVSPQKKSGIRSVYDELKKSLKRAPSGEKNKQRTSFSRTLAEMSEHMEDAEQAETSMMENENSEKPVLAPQASSKSMQKPVKQASTKPLQSQPPVALKKPTIDSDEENSMEKVVQLKRPGPSRPPLVKTMSSGSAKLSSDKGFRQRTNIPPPDSDDDESSLPAPPEDIRITRKQSGIGLTLESRGSSLSRTGSTKSIRPPPIPPPREDDTNIRPPAHSDDAPVLDSHMIDESILRKMDADVSAIPGPEASQAQTEGNLNDSGLTDGDDENDQLGGSQKHNWISSQMGNAIYGKILAMRWSCAQVGEFLDACGLSIYARNFAENGVDGPTLTELTHDQVRRGLQIHDRLHLLSLEMGVDSLRQRKIKAVKDWEWSCVRVSEWLEAKGLNVLVNPFKLGAVHGGVLFSLNEDQFVSELGVGRDSVLILLSLLACIERAREVGPLKAGDDVPDWSPSRVKVWLESLSLGHLVPVFKQYAVNGALLLYLDAQTMRVEMGVTEIQSIVLEKAILKLRKRQIRRQSFLGSAWKRLTNFFRSPAKARAAAAKKSVRAAAAEFGQGTFSSMTATYSKYATKGRRHHNHRAAAGLRTLKDDSSRTYTTPVKKNSAITTQQPSSAPPSRPPRPANDVREKAKLAVVKQQNASQPRLGEIGKVGSQKGKLGSESTNTMSIL